MTHPRWPKRLLINQLYAGFSLLFFFLAITSCTTYPYWSACLMGPSWVEPWSEGILAYQFDRIKSSGDVLLQKILLVLMNWIFQRKLEHSEGEMRNRLLSLQTGLENGEAVQKDFVRLSQSLQKELERLREQHKELRWEHEDDVVECRGCEQPFKSSSKKKVNCKHCGRIFCLSCLQHKVMSGPNQRESRVCQVCHTLLNSETAPYFSTEPPHQVQ